MYLSTLTLLFAIIIYSIIIYFFKNDQFKKELVHAEYAMSVTESLLKEKGGIYVKSSTLFAGNTNLNNSNIVLKVNVLTGFGCTIFYKNIRIATTAVANGKKSVAINSKANSEITNSVFIQQGEFKGSTTTIGKEWLIYYKPLINEKGESIGMLAVYKEYDDFLINLVFFKLIVGFIVLIMVILRLYLIYSNLYIKNKMKKNTHQLSNNADLLSEIGFDLSSSLSFNDIFIKLHSNVDKLLDAEVFGVRLLNQEKDAVQYKYEIESGKRVSEVCIPIKDKDNYSVLCILNNESILINDNLAEYKKYVKEIKVPAGKMPSSLIFVPLFNNEKVFGVITVQSFKKNAYSKADLKTMKTLAFYTGIALSNAHLYETLEDKVNKRTLDLENANNEILDSINYAKYIQDATLIDELEIQKLLPNSFVYYQPKQMVSGDFYRVDEFYSKGDEKLIGVLVADCTGHGVPGATLAVLCSNIIKQSHQNPNIFEPGHALTHARQNLITLFENSKTSMYDGMDIGFAVYNTKTRVIDFAGAMHNLYIVRNNKLIVYKGNRMPVGLSNSMSDFDTITIQLEKNDDIYLSSDGFPDQFGGERNKKYSRKRFFNLITGISGKSNTYKKEILTSEFINWKKDFQQTDDVCVLGFTVD